MRLRPRLERTRPGPIGDAGRLCGPDLDRSSSGPRRPLCLETEEVVVVVVVCVFWSRCVCVLVSRFAVVVVMLFVWGVFS